MALVIILLGNLSAEIGREGGECGAEIEDPKEV